MQTKRCTKCGEEKPHDQFSKCKRDGLQSKCKSCEKAYRDANKAARQNYHKTWAADNKDALREYRQKHHKANRDKALARMKHWQQNNPDKVNATNARRRAAKLQATPPWLTQDDFANIQQFYTIANQLTELNGQIYHVDHIIPLQGETVCGLHVPWNLQVLDGPENLAKHNKLILPVEMLWN